MEKMPESRYIHFFKEQEAKLRSQLKIIGDIMLVEVMKFPELKKGLLFIPEFENKQSTAISADKPFFCRVLMTGEGYYDDTTKQDVPLDTKSGNIILCGHVSAKLFSALPILTNYIPSTLGIVRESDVQIRWESEDSFNEFLNSFNDATANRKYD